MHRLLLPWTTLIAIGDVNAKAFYPASGWVPTSKAALLRGTFEQRASQTNVRVVFAYQVADSDGSPGAIYEVGTPLTADGFNYGALVDAAENTAGKQIVRFGWLVWYNTGGAVGVSARAGGFCEFQRA